MLIQLLLLYVLQCKDQCLSVLNMWWSADITSFGQTGTFYWIEAILRPTRRKRDRARPPDLLGHPSIAVPKWLSLCLPAVDEKLQSYFSLYLRRTLRPFYLDFFSSYLPFKISFGLFRKVGEKLLYSANHDRLLNL